MWLLVCLNNRLIPKHLEDRNLPRLQSRHLLINDALAIRDTMDVSFFLAIVDRGP